MTKLIFVNRYFYPDHSATSQILSDLAFALAANQEYEIHVVTSRQRYDDAKAALNTIETVNGVKAHRVWTSAFGRQNLLGRAFDYLSFYVTAFFALTALADNQSIIVAKTDPPLISVVAAIAAKLKSARLMNWTQDLFPEVAAALGVPFAKGPVYAFLKWLRNWSLQAAEMNIAIGELMARRLCDEGVSTDKIQVIHNWADEEQIKPIPTDQNHLRNEWGLDGKFVVGYSGNFGRGHSFTAILNAANILKANEDIMFLFIGGGANYEKTKKDCQTRQITNVKFLPYQPRQHLAHSLSAANLHLVTLKPTLEGLIVPSKFYGIIGAGRPALFIGHPGGELSRLITKYNCGSTIANTATEEAIANLILYLSQNKMQCNLLGKNGRNLLENKFGKHIAIKNWHEKLKTICAKTHQKTIHQL